MTAAIAGPTYFSDMGMVDSGEKRVLENAEVLAYSKGHPLDRIRSLREPKSDPAGEFKLTNLCSDEPNVR